MPDESASESAPEFADDAGNGSSADFALECRHAPRILTWDVGQAPSPHDGVLSELAAFGYSGRSAESWRHHASGFILRLNAVTAADLWAWQAAVDRNPHLALKFRPVPADESAGDDGQFQVLFDGSPRAVLDTCREVEDSAGAEPLKPLAALIRRTIARHERREFALRLPDGRSLELSAVRPRIMGIVNVTPDSFSDGGQFVATDAAIAHGLALVEQGAEILDIGGESTRPGAAPVDAAEERARVIPVIEGLSRQTRVPISIDSTKADVVHPALDSGASIINDVSGFSPTGGLPELAATYRVPVICMHMQGAPRTMQKSPTYADVVADLCAFFRERSAGLCRAGVPRDQIVIDPGFGFGKTLAHNLSLLRRLREFASLGQPILAGMSRKSMFAKISGAAVDDRLPESLTAHVLAGLWGAHLVRVHDVRPMAKSLAVLAALGGADANAESAAADSRP